MPSKPVLTTTALYLGDNGRCFCGEHAGASAKHTGRDLSGQPVLQLTVELAAAYAFDLGRAIVFTCEEPSCGLSVAA